MNLADWTAADYTSIITAVVAGIIGIANAAASIWIRVRQSSMETVQKNHEERLDRISV